MYHCKRVALRRDFAPLAATKNNGLKGAPTLESTMKKKHPVVSVPEVPQEPARRVNTKVRWLGMAKPDDPIYTTGLTVGSGHSKSTAPEPTSTPATDALSLRKKEPIKIRRLTPEEYRTRGEWQIGTVHRASQSAPASLGTRTKTARGKAPRK